MINVTGDLFAQRGWLCVTTNGFVKNNGRAVMGAGCAKFARDNIPDIDLVLGRNIRTRGNKVACIGTWDSNKVFSFPVKHNWWEHADIALITQSAYDLRDMWLSVQDGNPKNAVDVYIPRPGCGNGKLDYRNVEPVLARILTNDHFKIITF